MLIGHDPEPGIERLLKVVEAAAAALLIFVFLLAFVSAAWTLSQRLLSDSWLARILRTDAQGTAHSDAPFGSGLFLAMMLLSVVVLWFGDDDAE